MAGTTDEPSIAYDPKQAQIEADQRAVARSSLKGSLSIILLGAAVGVPIGIASFLFSGDTVTIASVVSFVLLLSFFSWVETPFRFPRQVLIDDGNIILKFRFGRQKAMAWADAELIRTGKLGPGRFYELADYSAWLYRKGKRVPGIRANIGQAAYRELISMAYRRGVRVVMYPPEKT